MIYSKHNQILFTDNSMTNRIHVTLPDSVFREVEAYSTKMGRSPANLCAYLIEFCLATGNGFNCTKLNADNSSKNI